MTTPTPGPAPGPDRSAASVPVDQDATRLLAGRYELLTTLGHGGMADVHRALDRILDREVAVKMLRESSTDDSDRSRFIAEARTLARLSHSGLVTVLDAGFGPDTRTLPDGVPASAAADQPYLVMELVTGPTLAATISRGPLPPEDVASIGVQLAQALDYVHVHDVVHRDIKPGNVLLGSGGRVKLADFGIARLLGDSAGHTRTGHTIGTAAYLAPEQVTGGSITGATDVYSLGLVLLEALTARREYPGTATEAALARLHRAPVVPDSLPAQWQELLTAMTADEPGQRPTADQVARELSDQPTGPLPAATHDTADPATVPLLGDAPTATPAPDGTRVLTSAPSSQPDPPRDGAGGAGADTTAPSWIDHAGDVLARQPRVLADRFRRLSPSQRGALIAAVALVFVLLVIAVVGSDNGTDGRSSVPENTPSDLRGPLQELHDAVNQGAG